MRRPLSLVTQAMIAIAILAAGAGLWLGRAHVTDALASVLGTTQPEAQRAGRGSRGGARKEAVPVVVQTVGAGRNDLVFSGIGTARAIRHVTLYPAVSGEICKVWTRAGDRVSANDKIIELDDRQAQLAIDMARSKLEGAKRLLSRADQLRRRNVQSEAHVEDATTVADQAAVELKAAQVSLTDHTIRAPFEGIVGISNVDVGDRVAPTTALVTLDDRSRLTVEFDVPEQYLPRLERGMKVEVRTPGFGDRRFAGILSAIDSRVHPTRRTIVIRAEVPNPDDLLRPGMSFSVDLNLPGKSHPKIPDLALQFSHSGNYVWLAKGDSAQRVPVSIVRRDSNSVLIDGDIRPGDRIVVEGVQRLRNGRRIEVADVERPGEQAPRSGIDAKVN